MSDAQNNAPAKVTHVAASQSEKSEKVLESAEETPLKAQAWVAQSDDQIVEMERCETDDTGVMLAKMKGELDSVTYRYDGQDHTIKIDTLIEIWREIDVDRGNSVSIKELWVFLSKEGIVDDYDMIEETFKLIAPSGIMSEEDFLSWSMHDSKQIWRERYLHCKDLLTNPGMLATLSYWTGGTLSLVVLIAHWNDRWNGPDVDEWDYISNMVTILWFIGGTLLFYIPMEMLWAKQARMGQLVNDLKYFIVKKGAALVEEKGGAGNQAAAKDDAKTGESYHASATEMTEKHNKEFQALLDRVARLEEALAKATGNDLEETGAERVFPSSRIGVKRMSITNNSVSASRRASLAASSRKGSIIHKLLPASVNPMSKYSE